MARILLADDDEIMREYVSMILEEANYEIDVVCDGMQAIRKIRETEENYDLVISDLQMPPEEWGGNWLVEQIANEVPVLILSERGGIANAVAAIQNGAAGYVEKSNMDMQLLGKIEKILYESKTKKDEEVRQAKQYYPSLQQLLGSCWDILSEESRMMLATSEKNFHNHSHDITYDFSSAGNPLVKVIERESNYTLMPGICKFLRMKAHEDLYYRALQR